MITQKIIARTDSLKLDKIISRYGEDSMRQVVFIIVRPDPESEELIPITIPEDAVGSFRILKPSGNFVIVPMSKSVLSTGETAFDVVLPASANTAKGSGYYDIRITSDTDKYYFTAQGDFLIDDNIISDEVLEDVSEVNGLIFPDDFLTVEDHVAYIDDDTISTDSTWSSNKISEEIEAHAGGDVSKTVSGNPITFDDGADAPLVKCVTEIQGSQDLHGYTKPWVGGAGKNKCAGEYVTTTSSGVTFTANSDGTVLATNTSTGYAYVNSSEFTIKAGSYTFSGAPSGNNKYLIAIYSGGSLISQVTNGSEVTISFESDTAIIVRCAINGADVATNVTFKPMIRLSTETDPTFTPYSNICPITAYNQSTISVGADEGYVSNDFSSANGVTKTIESDGVLLSADGITTYQTASIGGVNNLIISPGTYMVSVNVLSVSNPDVFSALGLRKSSYNFVNPNISLNTVGNKSAIITTTESTYISMVLNGGTAGVQNSIKIADFKCIKLAQQSTATFSQSIYQGNADFIGGSGSPKVKATHKLYTPTSWEKNNDHEFYSHFATSEIRTGTRRPCISDKFRAWDGTESTSTYGICFINTDGALRINTEDAYSSASDMVAAIGDISFVCDLATPTEEDITPTNLPIRTLSGYTHIESSTGDMEVEYITERFQPLIDSIKQL